MNHSQHNKIVNFIWGIADDVLRDVFVRGKYRDVILPFTVLTNTKFTAYSVAMTDFLKPPVIRGLDSSGYTGAVGELIIVKAIDDFRVVGVHVSILNAAGVLLEEGEAQLPDDAIEDWHYIVTVANPGLPGTRINVRAKDKARNVTEAEFVL